MCPEPGERVSVLCTEVGGGRGAGSLRVGWQGLPTWENAATAGVAWGLREYEKRSTPLLARGSTGFPATRWLCSWRSCGQPDTHAARAPGLWGAAVLRARDTRLRAAGLAQAQRLTWLQPISGPRRAGPTSPPGSSLLTSPHVHPLTVLALGGAGGLAPGAAQAGADTVSPPRRPYLPSDSLAAHSFAAHPTPPSRLLFHRSPVR